MRYFKNDLCNTYSFKYTTASFTFFSAIKHGNRGSSNESISKRKTERKRIAKRFLYLNAGQITNEEVFMDPKVVNVPDSDKMEIVLLPIDNQSDFCNRNGSLFVEGADKDSERLAKGIKKNIKLFDRIVATKDAHRGIHIAHKIFWVDKDGNHPDYFTAITVDQVVGPNAKWRTTNPAYQKWAEEYVAALEKQGSWPLMIWPEHCLIGSKGEMIEPVIFEQFRAWEDENFAIVDYVNKGDDPMTEHYSAFKAEVFNPNNPAGTGPNMDLVDNLKNAKLVYICGQALSHCVRATVLDIADHFGDEFVKKFVFLEDASSPVNLPPAIEAAKQFMDDMTARGMRVTTTDKMEQMV